MSLFNKLKKGLIPSLWDIKKIVYDYSLDII